MRPEHCFEMRETSILRQFVLPLRMNRRILLETAILVNARIFVAPNDMLEASLTTKSTALKTVVVEPETVELLTNAD